MPFHSSQCRGVSVLRTFPARANRFLRLPAFPSLRFRILLLVLRRYVGVIVIFPFISFTHSHPLNMRFLRAVTKIKGVGIPFAPRDALGFHLLFRHLGLGAHPILGGPQVDFNLVWSTYRRALSLSLALVLPFRVPMRGMRDPRSLEDQRAASIMPVQRYRSTNPRSVLPDSR